MDIVNNNLNTLKKKKHLLRKYWVSLKTPTNEFNKYNVDVTIAIKIKYIQKVSNIKNNKDSSDEQLSVLSIIKIKNF